MSDSDEDALAWELKKGQQLKELAADNGWDMDGPEVAKRRKHIEELSLARMKAALKKLKAKPASPSKAKKGGVKGEGKEPVQWVVSTAMAWECNEAGYITFQETSTFTEALEAYPGPDWTSDRR